MKIFPAGIFDIANYRFNLHAVPLFLAIILIVLLSAKVVSRKSRAHIYFGVICLSIVVWMFFTALGYLVADSSTVAIFWFKMDWVGVCFISVGVYSFAVHFTNHDRPIAIRIGFLLGSIFAATILIMNPLIVGVQRYWWGLYPRLNPRFTAIFFLFFFGYMLSAFYELNVAYRLRIGVDKTRVGYVLLALGIAYIGSIDFLPTFGYAVYPGGFLAILLFVGITAYAIVKHQLLDVRVTFRKTLLYSLVSAGTTALYAGLVTLIAHSLENPEPLSDWAPRHLMRWMASTLRAGFSPFLTLSCLMSLGLGIFVLFKGPRKPINALWGLTCLSVAIWCFGLAHSVNSPTASLSLLWADVQYSGTVFIPILFLHFTSALLSLKAGKVLALGYMTALFLLVMTWLGYLFTMAPAAPFQYYVHPLPLYQLFALYFFIFVWLSLGFMALRIKSPDAKLRNQVKFILFGMTIAIMGGSTTFFMVYGISIFPYGIYTVPIYAGAISYAVFKHQLMDINLVIRKTLVYSLVSATLAAIYVGTITLLAHVLGVRHGSVSAFSSALAAIFITLLFNPLRNRLQSGIDRKFGRSRGIGHAQLVELSSQVISHATLENIANSVGKILEEAMPPKRWALYFRASDDREFTRLVSARADVWPERLMLSNAWSTYFLTTSESLISMGQDAATLEQYPDLGVVVPLIAGRNILGYLMVGQKRSEESFSEEDLVLVRMIANQTAVAFERSTLAKQISSTFVHEIKTPLTNISLPAELTFIDLSDVEAGKKEAADVIPKIKVRMKYILDQARLAGYKVDAVKEISEPQEGLRHDVDVKELVGKALHHLASLIADAAVHVSTTWPETLQPLSARAQQLEIVIVNVIKNAVEAMQKNPEGAPRELTLSASSTKTLFRLAIQDTGPGIKDLDQAMLFQSHFSTKGTDGVGLFLSRQIVAAHGGQLIAQSQEGVGTTFMLSLPLSEERAG